MPRKEEKPSVFVALSRREDHISTKEGSMIVPMNRRNDKHDPSPAELLLIRAGHHLWLNRKQALKSETVSDYRAFDAALETIWEAKRHVRAELKEQRARAAERTRAYFAALPKAA